VIFLHGFPDSSLSWRYITQSSILQENATLVTVDLPGFAGSDSFPHYGAIEVLEALTEFIVGMREQYLGRDDSDGGRGEGEGNKVFIVGHDWGCVLSYRLAAEAPCLANRFILTNGPLVCERLDILNSCLTYSIGPTGVGQQRPYPHL
jgi:pimeloyl-ACP methyl ester carboxylesterase